MIRTMAVLVMASLLGSLQAQGQSNPEALNGLTFAGIVTGGSLEEGVPDTLSFVGCGFSSRHFAGSGFPTACYRVDEGNELVRFDVENAAGTGGTIRWKGKITGDELDGLAILKRVDGSSAEFRFVGKKLPAGKD